MKFTYDKQNDDRECVAYLHSSGSLFFNCSGVYNSQKMLQGAVVLGDKYRMDNKVSPNGTGDLKLIIKHDNSMGHKFYRGDKVEIEF